MASPPVPAPTDDGAHSAPTVPPSALQGVRAPSPGLERPAGGMTRSGAKTPRKVQWTSDVKAGDGTGVGLPGGNPVMMRPSESEDVQSTHALDEHGLDPLAFQVLRDALARHQSSGSLPHLPDANGSSSFPISTTLPTSIPPPQPLPPINTTTSARPGDQTWAGTTISSSPTSSPPDIALPGLVPVPLAAQPNNPRVIAAMEHHGEHYVDPNERAGLPSMVHEDAKDVHDPEREAVKAAANVVRAHTRYGLWGRKSKKGSGSGSKAAAPSTSTGTGAAASSSAAAQPEKKPSRWSSWARHYTSDVEASAPSTPGPGSIPGPRAFAGGGLLSALLSLYDQQDGTQTRSTSGASTPASTGDESFEDEKVPKPWMKDEPRGAKKKGEHKHARSKSAPNPDVKVESPPLSPVPAGGKVEITEMGREMGIEEKPAPVAMPPGAMAPGAPSPSAVGGDVATGGGENSHSPSPQHGFPRTSSGLSSFAGMMRNTGDLFTKRSSTHAEHPTSLSALIASTGNISGAAAPAQAALAPNLERPGYSLSRYTLEAVPMHKPKKHHRERRNSTSGGGSGRSTPGTESGYATPAHTSGAATPARQSPPGAQGPSPSLANGGAVGSVMGTGSPPPHANTMPMPFIHAQTHPQSPLHPHQDQPQPHHHQTGFGKLTKTLSHLPQAAFNVPGMMVGSGGKGSSAGGSTPVSESDAEESEKARERRETRERKRKRKKAEIFITRHVAQIIQRQDFLLKLARAMMMFGGPSHRLQAQLLATARVLEIELSCMYLPDTMLISFDDSSTGTSQMKFIRQGSALDLGKLQEAHMIFWRVIHDDVGVAEASGELDELMMRRPRYSARKLILIGGFCSCAICSVGFSGSFVDSLISFPLGALLVAIQMLSVRNELYSNVFEITIATILSFLAAALAHTEKFCFTAVASSSVVLILPGFIVLCGALEVSSRSIVAGSVRLTFAVIYALFLGFGLAIGAEVYSKFTGQEIFGASDYTCSLSHDASGPWYQQTPSIWWAFLTVPAYSFFLSLRNQAPIRRIEMPLLVIISCAGWVTNHFVSKHFPGQSDISSAVGAFAVGFISNIYARLTRGNAFPVMITGILFQLPSGLSNGGLLTFATQTTLGNTTSYLNGFQTALQLISVSIGLAVGLGISLVVVYPIQSKRRAGGVFSL